MMEGNNIIKELQEFNGSSVAPEVRSCLCRRYMEWSLRRIKTQWEGIGASMFPREDAAGCRK